MADEYLLKECDLWDSKQDLREETSLSEEKAGKSSVRSSLNVVCGLRQQGLEDTTERGK